MLICLLTCLCNLAAGSAFDKNLNTKAADANVDHSFSDATARADLIRVIAHTAQVGIDSVAITLVPAVTLLLGIPIVIAFVGQCSHQRDAEDDAWKNSEGHLNSTYQTGAQSPSMSSVPGPTATGGGSPGLVKSQMLSPKDQAAVSPMQAFGGHLAPLLKCDSRDSAASSESGSPIEYPSELLLCPGLVVKQPGGVTLKMQGLCAPYKQSAMLDVSRTDSHGQTHLVARANISEIATGGGGGGVVLESASRSPLAFLYTERAVPRESDPPPADRYVTASSVSSISKSVVAEPLLLFTIKADGANEGFVMLRGPPPGEAMILLVRVHGDGSIVNVVDVEGKLLAATEARDSIGNSCEPIRLLHIAHGVDAGLILVAIIAAQKLS